MKGRTSLCVFGLRGLCIFAFDMSGYVWYNRGDAMKRKDDVRRLVESTCACVPIVLA